MKSDPELIPFIEEQRNHNLVAQRQSRKMPLAGSLPPAAIRQARAVRRDGSATSDAVANVFDETLAVAGRALRTRVFPVPATTGTVLHFHGGGWALGSVCEQDAFLAELAQRTGVTARSIDYPLAPETSLPDILDIAADTLQSVIENHHTGPIAIVGESAGAHVALMSVMRLRSHPALLRRVRAMSLAYGIYDLSMTPSQRNFGDEFLGLSTPWLEWFYALALPGYTREARRDPALSPLYADLAGLPPAQFHVGTRDALLDDSVFLFQRWQQAGNEGVLLVYPEAPHGFNHAGTAMASACNRRTASFLATHLQQSEASR